MKFYFTVVHHILADIIKQTLHRMVLHSWYQKDYIKALTTAGSRLLSFRELWCHLINIPQSHAQTSHKSLSFFCLTNIHGI